jgi:hypothetical protein
MFPCGTFLPEPGVSMANSDVPGGRQGLLCKWYALDMVTYQTDSRQQGTGAFHHVGVNAHNGLISFFNVNSALRAAIENWGVTQPHLEDLPKLRKLSDIA